MLACGDDSDPATKAPQHWLLLSKLRQCAFELGLTATAQKASETTATGHHVMQVTGAS